MDDTELSGPVRGRVDGNGRLIAADDALAQLQARCGGLADGPVAVPQLASIARLARRLGIIVSRGVIVADGSEDLDLWVRARPDGDGVALSIVGWTRQPARAPAPAPAVEREHDFIRAAADWLWEADPALRLTALSAGAAAAIGAASAALVGSPITRLFRFVPDGEGRLAILDALAEQRRFDDQLAEVTGDPPRRFRLAAMPLIDAAGQFAGFQGMAASVAELPAAPAAPAPTAMSGNAFGERLDRALRAPLDRIVADAETIRARADGPLRRDYAQYAADIAAAARHMLALVDDLVDLSAIESADFRPLVEDIDLAEMARSAAGLLGVRAADRGVTIERPAPGDTLPARGEFRRVLQILVNLLGNAIRYAPAGSAVTLRAERDGTSARITVADNGPGIAAADQTRVFEKFERLDPSEPGGAGLGLYIARRLARAMGGDITVHSVPGEGAAFVLTLPAVGEG